MLGGRKKTIGLAIVLIALFVGRIVSWPSIVQLPFVQQIAVGYHQKGVIRELSTWSDEHSDIRDDQAAVRSAKMIAYIQDYYPPGENYRSNEPTQTQYIAARSKAIQSIAQALTEYTGSTVNDPLDWPIAIDNWLKSKNDESPGDQRESR